MNAEVQVEPAHFSQHGDYKKCTLIISDYFRKDYKMYHQNIDTKLQKRIQSKEFEESVDQAVRSFMYDLDFMLLEEQHACSSLNYTCIQEDAVVKWVNPV